ncbi:MAG: ATP-binding cassette domain-containing protein [Bacteroidales bacterium]|nr:ATP-binding cassette domain-containing protein [Candidatus Cacconaster equifaecalis]
MKTNPIVRILKPAGSLLAWTVVVLFLTMAVDIAIPLFSQVFVDSIITNRHPEWQEPMIITLAIVVLVSFASVLFGVSFKRRVTLKYYIFVATRLFWHALRLQVNALSHYSPGNIVARIKSGYSTVQNLSLKLLPSFVVVIQVAVMLILMLFYSPVLSLVSLASVVINVVSLRMVAQKQKDVSRKMEESNSGMQSLVMSGISNIETIKAAGAEGSFFRKAMDAFGQFINSNNKLSVNLVKLNFLPTFLQQATSMLSLCLGAIFIIKGEMTIGSLMAFQGFLGQFLRPVTLLTRTNQLLLSASTSTERMLEIIDYPTDVPSAISLPETELSGKLKGKVQIENVTFGYDRNLPPLIENLSLSIEPGKRVALVGGSGSGKSTLANLITGLHQPWSGEILYDGKKKSEIDRYEFYNSMSVVNQDIVLFDGTVSDNIKMWDDVTEDFTMVLAARSAQIHQDIAQRPDGYETVLTGGGSNFSGGQRQRIEIATALAKEPTIIVMDEATSALDPATEAKVMDHIKDLGITMVIVAHRLSTIRDCDEIIVLENGRITDRGTHDELMKHTQGLYYKMMQMN